MPGLAETLFLAIMLGMYVWGYCSGHRAGSAKQRIRTERILERMLNH